MTIKHQSDKNEQKWELYRVSSVKQALVYEVNHFKLLNYTALHVFLLIRLQQESHSGAQTALTHFPRDRLGIRPKDNEIIELCD